MNLHAHLMIQLLYLRIMSNHVKYTEDNIKSLDWKDHIRIDQACILESYSDDGIYILLKEIIDNSIDEFVMGSGKIEINTNQFEIIVRDYGGIPLGKLVGVVSKMNTKVNDSKGIQKIRGFEWSWD